jgi:hypothetical protein
LQQILTNTSKEVKRACNASIPSEGDESLRHNSWLLWLSDALIIDHPNIQLKQLIQQRHVVRLRLNRVREKEVSLISQQILNRHFLNPKDNLRFRDIILNDRACILKLVIAVATTAARLNQNPDTEGYKLSDLIRSQGTSPFPLVLAFSHDCDCLVVACFYHQNI